MRQEEISALLVEKVLEGVDACIVTHVHPDHIDMAADGTVGAALPKNMPVFVQSDEDAAVCAKYDKLVDKADAEQER